jgi:hypothetical protein
VLLPGEKPVKQSGASVSHMQVASRRRRKAYTDGRILVHEMMLTGEQEVHHL